VSLPETGFTLIEIALSLGVIAFALVAIIGILPTGMQVQKENREETIISQDANLLLDAIRSGSKGLDDLTNYVIAITNYVTTYDSGYKVGQPPTVRGYTYRDSTASPRFPINNGARIIGLLSTPKYIGYQGRDLPPRMQNPNFFISNYVVAYCRALSGAANDKFPQTNATIQDLAFSYRLSSDVVPYANYDLSWTNFTQAQLSPDLTNSRYAAWQMANSLQTNLFDVRLIFRWPLLPNGNVGTGRQVFRTMAGGHLQETEEFGFPKAALPGPWTLFFFEPRTYVSAP
jgi:type II secretory pathway pseudopilin PulG